MPPIQTGEKPINITIHDAGALRRKVIDYGEPWRGSNSLSLDQPVLFSRQRVTAYTQQSMPRVTRFGARLA